VHQVSAFEPLYMRKRAPKDDVGTASAGSPDLQ
jgi:hypothetical protein